jgi:hypothetical protein
MASMKLRMGAVAVMAVGILATFLLFMLRYGWYTTPQNALALNVGFGIFLVGCGIAWFVFPSKILMLSACLAVFAYPPAYDSKNFVRLDWKFVPFMAVCVMLLVAAIEMRRRAGKGE